MLERFEGRHSVGIGWGGRILRDGGKAAYLSLQGGLLSGQRLPVSGNVLVFPKTTDRVVCVLPAWVLP